MTRAQYDALRDAIETFDPERDDPCRLLIGAGLDPYDLAVELLAFIDADRAQVAA